MDSLRVLLRDQAILRTSPDHRLLDQHGAEIPWMFYSWNVTLTHAGAELIARCLLDRLTRFQSTQLATFGLTGVPILNSCILLGGGRYTGLCLREQPKQRGSMRRIEGPADRARSVVLLDDSLASGQTTLKAIQLLEQEGFTVEGCLALVAFPYSGKERIEALGYRVEVLFDVYRDLEIPLPVYRPVHEALTPSLWGPDTVPSGLHPALAARYVARAWLRDGLPPRPPQSLDAPVDARGGTFVSLRRQDNDARLARGGFWHFAPEQADACRDLVLATLLAVQEARPTPAALDQLKLAVTFCGPMERIPPSQLSFLTHGIVVRSRLMETKMGGALPNTQVFTNEGEQYHHARVRNANIWELEPHDLYRHTLTKHVEPGQTWLPYGFPYEAHNDWTLRDDVGSHLLRRVRQILHWLEEGGELAADPVAEDLVPEVIYGVGVNLHHQGIVGAGLSWDGSLDDCLHQAVRQAWSEAGPRWQEEMGFSVSLLHSQEQLGVAPAEVAAHKVRLGLDTLTVQQGVKCAIVLGMLPVWSRWSKTELGHQLLGLADIQGGECRWSTYQTACWLSHPSYQGNLHMGFPDRRLTAYEPPQWRDDAVAIATYIHHRLPRREAPAAQQWLALWALDMAARLLHRSDWQKTVHEELELANPQDSFGHALLALTQGQLSSLSFLRSLLLADGRIVERPGERGIAIDHDCRPGLVLLALAAQSPGPAEPNWASHLEWYRRRFLIVKSWEMFGWHSQAWSSLWRRSGRASQAEFVFEMADWAVEQQHQQSGAFLLPTEPFGFSCQTAFLAAGMAEAWGMARQIGEGERILRYQTACRGALHFVQRLIVRPEDTFCLSEGILALGGVRSSLTSSELPLDGAAYALVALLKGWEKVNNFDENYPAD